MSDLRNVTFRAGSMLLGVIAVAALFGCPPPQNAGGSGGASSAVNQRELDSLRADSAKKCRFHSSFAYNYARSNLRNDAITQFQKALVYCGGPKRAEVERFYATYLDEWDMGDSATVHFLEAGRLDSTNARIHFWLYSYYHDQGEYGQAIEELLMASRHQEDVESKVRWMKVAAEMLAAEGDNDRACAMYAQLQQMDPADGEIAESMVQSGCIDDPEALLATLRSACSADTLGDICRRLAQEEENFGNDVEALIIYQRFANAEPDDIPIWESVLSASKRLDEQDVILEALTELARIQPESPVRAAQLIDEQFARDRWRAGGRVLVSKLRDNPESAHLLYLAGLYYSRPGTAQSDTARALEHLDRAVRTNEPDWKRTALGLHDGLEPPLDEEAISQAQFFGKDVKRLHRCSIPGREKQNEVLDR
jgi:tetratricopeptide (TPR) repeat protein